MPFLILSFIISILALTENATQSQISSRELIVSDTDIIIVFSISIAVVMGIFLYLTRHIIIRKKTEYDEEDYESKKDRDYEKYHSDWTSDDVDFGEKEWDAKDEEEFVNALNQRSLPNYYKILGVSQDSSQDEIKQQYRKLAKQWHPDIKKDTSSKEKMSEINRAYEILSDKERRKRYDEYLDIS